VVIVVSGCGSQPGGSPHISASLAKRANDICRVDDAQIRASEAALQGDFSERTLEEIHGEILALAHAGLVLPLAESLVDARSAISAAGPGGLGPVTAERNLVKAQRAANALGVKCSFGAPQRAS
jgi:hypothetical protein